MSEKTDMIVERFGRLTITKRKGISDDEIMRHYDIQSILEAMRQ